MSELQKNILLSTDQKSYRPTNKKKVNVLHHISRDILSSSAQEVSSVTTSLGISPLIIVFFPP